MRVPILVTGVAGFIGYYVSRRLLEKGYPVVGLDNLNNYYDAGLKKARLEQLDHSLGFHFIHATLEDRKAVEAVFSEQSFPVVIHLAAQAGVRYSLNNPHAYIDSNIIGFMNILEACRHHQVEHLIYASSSSVYGANRKLPFAVTDNVDHPVSLYAATKKANELMAHTYSHLYGLPATGLRFFTVYGPWGRPDMAYFMFTRKMLTGEPIQVFNHGNMKRDFTYINDVVEAIIRLIPRPPQANPNWDTAKPTPGSSFAPYKVYNIGNNKPVKLLDFIAVLEEKLGVEAKKELLPMQPGDVEETYADVSDLMNDVGFRPDTPLDEGIGRFVEWYRWYYQI